MSPQPTRSPLAPISKNYHDTVEIFVRSFGKFFGVSIVPALISFLLGVAFIGTFFGSLLLSVNETGPAREGYWIGSLVVLTILVIQILGICALYYMTIHHQRVSVLTAFEQSVGFFVRFIGYGVVFVAVTALGTLVGAVLVGVVLGLVLGMTSTTLTNGSFGWLSFIPAIISAALTSFFVFTGFSIVDKNLSLRAGLRESYRLVRGHYLPVVLRLALLYSVVSVLTFLLTRLPIAGSLLSLLFITPFTAIYLSVLYQDLAKR